MNLPYQFNPYMLSMLVSAGFAGTLCLYVWRYRTAPGALPFVVLLLTSMLWGIASALELAATDPSIAIFWAKMQAVPQVVVGTAAFCFTLDYVGFGKWLNRTSLILLAIPPLILALLILTNDAPSLVWTRVWFDRYVHLSRGPAILAAASYVMVLSLLALGVWTMLLFRWRLHRWLVGGIFLVMVTVRIANLLDLLNLNPIAPLNLTILAIDLSCLVYFIALYRFQFFDVTPIARATALEQTTEGMMVLDRQNRIAELNPAVQMILGVSLRHALGQEAKRVLSAWPNLVERLDTPTPTQVEIQAGAEPIQYYNAHLLPLVSPRGFQLGRLLLFHDISELKRAHLRLVEQQRVMATLAERERLARELHDTLVQATASIRMQAETTNQLLTQGETAAVRTNLGRIADAAQEMHLDLREYLFGMPAPLATDQSFFVALRNYLAQFEQRWMIPTQLRVPAELEQRGLGTMVEAQILRIVQEALSNVRKHASAHHVEVIFEREAMQVQLIIQDDGRGFDPAQLAVPNARGFGTRSMRERAQAIGGRFEMQSPPGKGTRVIVNIPGDK